MAHAAGVLTAGDLNLPPDQLVFGITPKMRALRNTLDKLAPTNIPVLIRGERGTGKEIIARMLHRKSPRRAAPFVRVRCSEIQATSLEVALFGHESGSVAGDGAGRPEILRQAAHGTLFFDEIGDLSRELQAKLLRLLESGQFNIVDRREVDQCGVRLLCASNRNLEGELKTGGFRPDLFYRINVVSIHVPPLRERTADIPMLVRYFLDRCAENLRSGMTSISPARLRSFEVCSWPGNIRELENLIQRYVILGSESAIDDSLSKPIVETTE